MISKRVNTSHLKNWLNNGEHMVWLASATVSLSLLIAFAIVLLLLTNGLGHFWQKEIYTFKVENDDAQNKQYLNIIGELVEKDSEINVQLPNGNNSIIKQTKIRQGNRELTNKDFLWVKSDSIISSELEPNMVKLERVEWGNFYGRYIGISLASGGEVNPSWQNFKEKIAISNKYLEEIAKIKKNKIGKINFALRKIQQKRKKHLYNQTLTQEIEQSLVEEEKKLQEQYQSFAKQLEEKTKTLDGLGYAVFEVANLTGEFGYKPIEVPLKTIIDAWQPNKMSLMSKLKNYFIAIGKFLSDDPREANTEGGIFPAIFGTISMVFLMTIVVTPLGVIAAIYLKEYAKKGLLVKLIRISVNNLAGVPSVVFGIFGLGFFVYFVGGGIDKLFYPELLPNPTFGTPGILWSSLTLALLTLPVVIVSTEEGLGRIPRSIREGSLSIGANKFETLVNIVIPLASPSIMTGLILAIARAAGEVAPLMLVGVVKHAPTLPINSNPPFLHLDQKFMHLGFHIYDLAFQSPNIETTLPLVYASALLLVLLIIFLNLTAILLRNHLRNKYRQLDY